MNAAMLLGTNQGLEQQIEQIRQAVVVSNLPYRMTRETLVLGAASQM